MITKKIIEDINKRRKSWFVALKNWDHYSTLQGLERQEALLIAAVFSIIATANGKPINYASDHENIKGILNSYLNGKRFSQYADIIRRALNETKCQDLLTSTVGNHIKRHTDIEQISTDSEIMNLLKFLVPEIFDPLLKDELQFLDALPEWIATC